MKFPDPVISVAIEPKTKADSEKLSASLARLAEEDPQLSKYMSIMKPDKPLLPVWANCT